MSLALCHGAQTGQVAASFTRLFNVPEDTGPKEYWNTWGAELGVWWRPYVGEDVGVGGGVVDGGGDMEGRRGGERLRSNPNEQRPEPIPGDGTPLQWWKGNVHIPWWHFGLEDEHSLAMVESYIGPRELVVDGMVRVEEGEVPHELLGL